MAQTPSTGVDFSFLEKAVAGITNPYILAGVIVACFLIWQLPSIISATSEAIRLGRAAKVETEGRRKILENQVKSLEDKRLRKKRRERQ